jgi:hypothetical protein
LLYVDDVLVVSHDPQDIMNARGTCYTLKPGSVREPKEYLRAPIGRCNIATETELEASSEDEWSMSCNQYVKHAVADVELDGTV